MFLTSQCSYNFEDIYYTIRRSRRCLCSSDCALIVCLFIVFSCPYPIHSKSVKNRQKKTRALTSKQFVDGIGHVTYIMIPICISKSVGFLRMPNARHFLEFLKMLSNIRQKTTYRVKIN